MTTEDEVAQANQDASECFLSNKDIAKIHYPKDRSGTVLADFRYDRLQAIPRKWLYRGDE